MPGILKDEYLSCLKEKNVLIVKVMYERESLTPDDKQSLELRIAELEGKIGTYLLDCGKVEDACVSFVSQASALAKAGLFDDAIKVYRLVCEKTSKSSLKTWISSEIVQLQGKVKACE